MCLLVYFQGNNYVLYERNFALIIVRHNVFMMHIRVPKHAVYTCLCGPVVTLRIHNQGVPGSNSGCGQFFLSFYCSYGCIRLLYYGNQIRVCVFIRCVCLFRVVSLIFTCHTLSTAHWNCEYFLVQPILKVYRFRWPFWLRLWPIQNQINALCIS